MANPRQIELLMQASQVGADVTYMPLLVDRSVLGTNNLDGQRAELFSSTGANAARSDGGDLRWYINSDQTSELASDLVSFSLDAVTGSNVAEVDQGEMQAWIGGSGQLISSVTNTPVFLEYGDSALTQYADGDPYGRNNVYDANYVSVWHMEQDPSSTAPQIIDSTGNGNHGTSNGGMTSVDLSSSQIGNGLTFDGASQSISIPGAAVSLANETSEITASVWVSTVSENGSLLGGRGVSGSTVLDFQIGFDGADNGDTGTLSLLMRGDNGGGLAHIHDSLPINDGDWHYVAALADASKNISIVRDGIVGATGAHTMTSGITVTDQYARLAAEERNSNIPNLIGSTTEFRVSNIARLAGWITNEYNNQNSPSTFWSVNLPNAIGVAPPVTLLQMTIGINKMNGGFA